MVEMLSLLWVIESEMKTETHDITIVKADFSSIRDIFTIITLINEYRNDPMGGNLPSLMPEEEVNLICGLKNHPVSIVLLAKYKNDIAGMIVGFKGFSTFKAQNLVNVHDLIVNRRYRGKGIGKRLLLAIADLAKKENCCRLTLEVRNDNCNAKRLYTSVGFKPCDNPMEFWVWPL